MTRVLQIGFGLFGKQRCLALQELFGDKDLLVDIVDPSIDVQSLNLTSFGLDPKKFRVVNEPHSSYELSIVSVPHHLALATLTEYRSTSKKILIEKPALTSVSESDKWREIGVNRDLFVGYNYRFLPHVRMLSKVIHEQHFGQIRRFEIFLGHGGSPDDFKSWKMDGAKVGGGAMLDPGSHCIDLVRTLIPKADTMSFSSASTSGLWPIGSSEDERWIASKDNLLISIHASLIEWRSRFQISVLFDDGYMILDGRDRSYGPPRLKIGRKWAWLSQGKSQSETEEEITFTKNDSIARELGHILGLSNSEWTYPASIEDAIEVLSFLSKV